MNSDSTLAPARESQRAGSAGTAVRVSDLGKAYRIYPSARARLREWLPPFPRTHTPKWVLRGLNFEVTRGEAVGIVGPNGAGKSTLLKILTGTTQASEGGATVHGRVAALLELGMGFHPDFTGRENARMAGELMGIPRDEIEEAMSWIVDFAEIGAAADETLRTYSSGMQLRLGFSVATAFRPDILIVDEALSVGDAHFQHKSIERIRSMRDAGTTLLFVSHDPGAVKTLCTRALLLWNGGVVEDGSPETVLNRYNALVAEREQALRPNASAGGEPMPSPETPAQRRQVRSGTRNAEILAVRIGSGDRVLEHLIVGDPAWIEIDYAIRGDASGLVAGFAIRDRLGNEMYGSNTHHLGVPPDALANVGGSGRVRFEIPALSLGPGTYSVSTALHAGAVHLAGNYDWWDRSLVFSMVPGDQASFVGCVALADVSARVQPLEPSVPG